MLSNIKRNREQSKGRYSAIKIGSVFKGKVFCVYGPRDWKRKMESSIVDFGGQISQCAEVNDLFAVVGDESSVLYRKAIKWGKKDVVSVSWIEKSISEGVSIPLKISDYVYVTDFTLNKLRCSTTSS